jgi:hypothetical protein
LLNEHRARAEDCTNDHTGEDERRGIMPCARSTKPTDKKEGGEGSKHRTSDFATETDCRNTSGVGAREYERNAKARPA